MNEETNILLHPRRVGVTGAINRSEINESFEHFERFCAAIGKALVARNAVVVTRGGKREAESEKYPVDELVVNAARATSEP